MEKQTPTTKDVIRVWVKLYLLFLVRAFSAYVIVHITVLFIILFLRYVLNNHDIDVTGHELICAAIGAYIALNTVYVVEGMEGQVFNTKEYEPFKNIKIKDKE